YFAVLQDAPEVTKGNRSYFADGENTRRALAEQDVAAMLESANLVTHFNGRGIRIRVGDIVDQMRHATLVSEQGIVYSVRDPEGRKTAHNYTVCSGEDSKRYSGIFAGQWSNGKPVGRDDVYFLADEGRALASRAK
ncbi:MAG: hypothetical protein ABIF01_00140, partial [Candidatus Micrarchaeota archaeon]